MYLLYIETMFTYKNLKICFVKNKETLLSSCDKRDKLPNLLNAL